MSKNIKCIVCEKNFEGRPNGKYCGKECRNKVFRVLTGRTGNAKISTATVGAISEYQIGSALMESGYCVFRAMSPASPCDLIAFKKEDGEVLFIEARTGYLSISGDVAFPRKCHPIVNEFGIYVPANKLVIRSNADYVRRGGKIKGATEEKIKEKIQKAIKANL